MSVILSLDYGSFIMEPELSIPTTVSDINFCMSVRHFYVGCDNSLSIRPADGAICIAAQRYLGIILILLALPFGPWDLVPFNYRCS